MSKKYDYVHNEIYGKHLSGGRENGPYRVNDGDIDLVRSERLYMRLLSEMSMNRFKWTGLPEHINERFLELTLFRSGLVIWYWDDRYNRYLTLRGYPSGPLNFYDEPVSFTVTGNSTFQSKTLSTEDCVPIWSNMLRTPDVDIVTMYARRLASIDRSIDINAQNARRSKVIVAEENQRQTATAINNEINKGSPTIFLNGQGMDLLSNITAVDLGIHPDGIEKLQLVRTRLWNDCMGLLGLNFANQDKRERMVVDEVSANDEQVGNMRRVHLNERKRAARAINMKYGLSIDVKYHVDVPEPVESTGGEL